MHHETWFPRSWHQYECHHIWEFLATMSVFLISQQIARWTWCVVCYLLNKKSLRACAVFWLKSHVSNLLHQRRIFMPALHLLSLSFSNYFTAFLLSYRQGPGKNLLPWKPWYNLCAQCEKFGVFWLVFFKRENNCSNNCCWAVLFCSVLCSAAKVGSLWSVTCWHYRCASHPLPPQPPPGEDTRFSCLNWKKQVLFICPECTSKYNGCVRLSYPKYKQTGAQERWVSGKLSGEFPQCCRARVFLLKDKTNFRYLCKTERENVQNVGIQTEALSHGGGAFNTDLWLQIYFFMFGTSENTSAFKACQHEWRVCSTSWNQLLYVSYEVLVWSEVFLFLWVGIARVHFVLRFN